MDYANLSDAEMVLRAHGADVLPPDEVARLQAECEKVTRGRIDNYYNKRNGWLLRRVARGHIIKRVSFIYCGLCGNNIKGAKRTKTNSFDTTCNIRLCTVPPPGQPYSCYYLWHNNDVIKKQIFRRKSKKRKHGDIEGENVEEESEEEEGEWIAESDEDEKDSGYDSNDSFIDDGPRNLTKLPPLPADAPVQAVAERQVLIWQNGKSLTQLLSSLPQILPSEIQYTYNENQPLVKRVNNARLATHPDRLAAKQCTALEEAVCVAALIRITNVYNRA